MPQLEENAVRPTESIYILGVSHPDVRLRRPRHDIVFFSNGVVAPKIF